MASNYSCLPSTTITITITITYIYSSCHIFPNLITINTSSWSSPYWISITSYDCIAWTRPTPINMAGSVSFVDWPHWSGARKCNVVPPSPLSICSSTLLRPTAPSLYSLVISTRFHFWFSPPGSLSSYICLGRYLHLVHWSRARKSIVIIISILLGFCSGSWFWLFFCCRGFIIINGGGARGGCRILLLSSWFTGSQIHGIVCLLLFSVKGLLCLSLLTDPFENINI